MLAPGPFPPSGPTCFSPATGSLNRSCAGGKPAARTSKQVESWKWRKASKVKIWSWCLVSSESDVWQCGLLAPGPSLLQGQGVLVLRQGPLSGAVQEDSQLQEQASKLEAGPGGRQAKWKFEASQFRKRRLAVCCLLLARAVLQEESQLQEQASKLEAGSGGRQAKYKFEASV